MKEQRLVARVVNLVSAAKGFVLRRKLLKETIWAYIGKGAAIVFGLAYTVLLTKMGPDRFGVYGLCTTLMSFIVTASSFGIGASAARYLSQHLERDRHLLSRVVVDAVIVRTVITAVLLVLCLAGFRLIASAMRHPELYEYRWAILITALAFTACDFPKSIFAGLHRQRFATTVVVAEHALKLALIGFFFFLIGLTVIRAMYAMAAAMFAAGFVGFAIVRANVFDRAAYAASPVRFRKAIFLYGLPLTLVVGNMVLLTQVDMILLGALSTPLQLGYYAMAKEVTKYLPIAASPLFLGTSPRFGAASAGNAAGLARLYLRILLAIVGILVLPCIIGYIFTPWIVATLFGTAYLPAVPAVRVLLAWVLAYGVGYMNLCILAYLGRGTWVAAIAFVCVVINVALNLVLIPEYGALGAAFAAVFAQIPAIFLGMAGVRGDLSRRSKAI